jgi:hypothetical protein
MWGSGLKSCIVVIAAILVASIQGCTTYYQVLRIPDSPDALAGYRQCVIAPHYSEVLPCMAGIPGFVTSIGESKLVRFNDSPGGELREVLPVEAGVIPGCREIFRGTYSDGLFDTYVCSFQACSDTTSVNPVPAGTFKDAKGNLHLRKDVPPIRDDAKLNSRP